MKKTINYLTVPEAAEMAGVTPRAITQAVARGELPDVWTLGGRTRVLPKASLEKWAKKPHTGGPKPKQKG